MRKGPKHQAAHKNKYARKSPIEKNDEDFRHAMRRSGNYYKDKSKRSK